jgi:hypothetical protein
VVIRQDKANARQPVVIPSGQSQCPSASDKVQNIGGAGGLALTVELGITTLGTNNRLEPPVLDIEVTGETLSRCTDAVHFRLFTPTFGALVL